MVNTTRLNESSPRQESPRLIQVRATVGPARVRPRHRGIVLSFALLVALPVLAVAIYLAAFAVPQYASTVGFTVRQHPASGTADLLGGLPQLALGATRVDADILVEFIESQALVERLEARFDLAGHYSDRYPGDPVFALRPEPTIEQALRHWRRVVRTSHSQSNGLIEVRVRAYSPRMAQALAAAIVEEGQALVNELDAAASADALRLAERDLAAAADRLRSARADLTSFRVRNRLGEPQGDPAPSQGVLGNLEAQLAEALIENDLLAQSAISLSDQRLRQSTQRIEVIRARIAQERAQSAGAPGDHAARLVEHEALQAERALAEQAHAQAVAVLDTARAAAARQSRYLAVYITPTIAETAEFPRAGAILGQVALFLVIGWAILVLGAYAIRDRQ